MIRAIVASLVLTACASAGRADEGEDNALQVRLASHIEFLADDLLRGRQPGTEGYDIAARYVASQFRQMGLRPAGVDGTYFQPVPMRRAWLGEGSARLELMRNGQAHPFRFVDDFYRGPSLVHLDSEVRAAMVFAGYGIDAPPLDYNDYDGLDVAGKVVVVLRGQPLDFPSEEGAHFSSGREVLRNAASRGAVGVLTIHTPRSEQRSAWSRFESSVGMPSMGWLDEDGGVFAGFGEIRGSAMLRSDAAAALFADAAMPLPELLEKDEAGEPLPHFELPGEIRMSQSSRHESISSPNVAGYLPGDDPLLGGEVIVYTAHLDHIGELHGEGHADAINNGALDNASGVSVMLETARMFADGQAPRRSILFLAVTAEEKGMVGSEYFARHPTVPPKQLAGVVNLDMPLLLGDFADVIAFGAEHSTIGDAVRAAAGEQGVALTPDPFPEQNVFVRSDHYRFVQQGVPAVFLVTGVTSADGTSDTRSIFEDFLRDHYHKPTDDANLPIDYRAAARFTRINYGIGAILANQLERPRWREGDFFGDSFGR